MKASSTWRRLRAAASAMLSTWLTESASGFSQSTCLPASSARTVHSAWRWLGSGL